MPAMAKAQKVLLRTDIFQAPQGQLVADAPFLKRLVENFRRMKACGLLVPVAWGHQPQAVPGDEDERASRQYYLSRLNAGYLDDLDLDEATGQLSMRVDCPGLTCDDQGRMCAWTRTDDGVEVKTAIKEVSAAIKNWRDGKGRAWDNSLIHVALTPLPVVDNQGGFKALSTEGFTLNLLDLTGENDVADDSGKKDEAGKGDAGKPDGGYFKKALDVLKQHGFVLPDDTDEGNGWERIYVAGVAKAEGDEGADDNDADDMEDDDDDDGMMDGTDPSRDGAVAEARPVMLSVSTVTDPVAKKLLAERQETHRKNLLTQVKRLERRGMKRHVAEKFREQLSTYELNLDASGDPIEKEVEYRLSVYDEVLPKKKFSEEYLARHAVKAAREHQEEAHVTQEEINRRAGAVSVGP